MLETLQQRAEDELTQSLHAIRPEEAAVMGLLQERLQREKESQEQSQSKI